MDVPLIMLGPGGAYVDRYEAQGAKIVKGIGQVDQQPSDAETDSALGNAMYVKPGRRHNPAGRQNDGQPQRRRDDTGEPSGDAVPAPAVEARQLLVAAQRDQVIQQSAGPAQNYVNGIPVGVPDHAVVIMIWEARSAFEDGLTVLQERY